MHLSRLFRPSVSSVFSVGTLLALVVALLGAPLGAQTAKSRAQLYTDIDTNLPSTTGAITAAVLRTQLKNVVASAYNVIAADAQPLDSDLTAIAALTTTSFGRGLLTEASAATLKTTLALNLVANTADADKPVSTAQSAAIAAAQAASQPLDADLTSIAALTTTAFGRSFLPLVDAADGRTLLGLGTLATQSGTFSGTSSGTNTGDNAVNSLYSGIVSNATHTGDATGSVALTLATVNANVGGFGSATAAPTFTVNGKGLITAAGSTTITPALSSITGLGTGIATALALNTGNAGAPVLIDGALGTPTSGVGTNLTALNATNLGSGTVPDARFPALTGEATTTAGAVAVTLTNSAVIGKVLTGYTSAAGTVAATDSILGAIQKLNGNDGNLQPLDAALTAISAGSDFVQFTGPATTTKVFTLPNATATILTSNAVVTAAQGGTGVANASTITLGGNLTHAGAFTQSFTATGNTALTLPTTGTLATLTGTEALSNKTITSSSFSGTTGAFTTLGATGAVTFDGVSFADGAAANTLVTTSGGNVGIGTASTESGFKLHVTGNGFFSQATGTVGKVVVDNADNRLVLASYFEAGVGQYSFISSTNNAETGNIPLLFQTGTTERMRITDAGNVGINSSSPAARLDVSGSAAFGVGSTTGFGITLREHTSGTLRNWVLRDDSGIDRLRFARGASDAVFWDVLKVAASDQTGNQIWYTNGAERMQLSTSGLDVTGGLTTTNGITSVFNNGTAQGINIRETTDATNANFVVFRKANSTGIGSITRVTTTDAVAYNTTSDGRLKTNIRDFTAADAARIIDGLRPRWFDWKSGDLTESVEETIDTGKKDKDGKAITEKRQKNQKVKDAARVAQHIADNKSIIGFIAQEEAAVDPALVRAGAVTVGDDDPTTISRQWARSDAALVPVVVAELKSLRARVAELEKENASLDARMAAVEALLKK